MRPRKAFVPRPAAHVAAHLGSKDDLLARYPAFLPPLPEDALRNASGIAVCPAGVNICAIEKVDARFVSSRKDALRQRLVRGPAELHGSEAQNRDLQIGQAKQAIFHAISDSKL